MVVHLLYYLVDSKVSGLPHCGQEFVRNYKHSHLKSLFHKNYNGFIINYGLANEIKFYENIEGENSYSSEATTSRGQNAYFLTTYLFKTRLLANYSEELQNQQYYKKEESD